MSSDLSTGFFTVTRVLPPSIPTGAVDIEHRLADLYRLSQRSNHVFASPIGPFHHRSHAYSVPRFVYFGPHTSEDSLRLAFLAGLDLNREFWRGSSQPEVTSLEDKLRRHAFDWVIALHADDTSHGIYGYSHGRVINEALLRPALAAAARFLPLNLGAVIDGFEAAEGVIQRCFEGVLSAPCEQQPRPFDVIFETPALAPSDRQIAATRAALESILAEYRRFLAYGQHL